MDTPEKPGEYKIRSAAEADVIAVQTLRKHGWQDNYVNPETGVTRDVLKTKLATLPVPQEDVEYYLQTLARPENRNLNLVAVDANGDVIGTVFFERTQAGTGDIGVFVHRDHRGKGIGSALLKALINATQVDLEVTIFARNRSRGLYKRFGFQEEGEEFYHEFEEGIGLPVQRLVLRRTPENS